MTNPAGARAAARAEAPAGAASPATATGGSSARSAGSRVVAVLYPAILVVLPLCLVVLHVRLYTLVSPLDAEAHIDYLYRSPAILHSGEHLGQQAMRAEACMGFDGPPAFPPCGLAHYSPSSFPDHGYSYEYQQPPAYYTLTAEVGRGLQAAFGIGSLVTAGELVGGLWLVAGLLVAYSAGRRLGVPRAALTGLLLFAASVPALLYQASTISNDASSFFVGAAVLWLVVRWREAASGRWWLLALAGLLGAAFKLTNLSIVMVGILYLLWAAWPGPHLRAGGGLHRRRRARAGGAGGAAGSRGPRGALPARPAPLRWRRAIGGAAALGVSWVLPTAAWSEVTRMTATVAPSVVDPGRPRFFTTHLPLHILVVDLGRFFPLASGSYMAPGLRGRPVHEAASVLCWALVAGVVVAAVRACTTQVVGLARAALPVAVLAPPAFAVIFYVEASEVFRIPTRYGLAVVPALVIAAAGVATGWWWRAAALVAGLAAWGVMAGALVAALR